MATAIQTPGGEPRHFMRMAVVSTAIILAGFGLEATRGRTDYAAIGWQLPVHLAVSLGWCALAIVQPWLIGARRRDLHRTLGWVGAVLAIALVVSGTSISLAAVAAGRLRPYNVFLVINLGSVIVLAALLGAGIWVRRRSDWHRRLLTGAMIVLTGPAWARLLPMERLGPLGLWVLTAAVLALVAWGAIWDRRVHGRVHPAWWWSAAAVSAPVLFLPLAFVPTFADWAAGLGPP